MADRRVEATIAVVDDEPSIRDLLTASLHFSGFDVVSAANCTEAINVIEKSRPDLIILDVMLPDIDGVTVTRRIRNDGITAPVLFLTARDDTQDKVMGLTVGGDDYVTKPFSLEEVVARIRAILRRTRQDEEDGPVISVADLEINEDSHDVSRHGVPVDLSPTEYKLLRYLMDNSGRVLSKAQISTTFGSTTGVVTQPSSNPTFPTCARRSTASPTRMKTVKNSRSSRSSKPSVALAI